MFNSHQVLNHKFKIYLFSLAITTTETAIKHKQITASGAADILSMVIVPYQLSIKGV